MFLRFPFRLGYLQIDRQVCMYPPALDCGLKLAWGRRPNDPTGFSNIITLRWNWFPDRVYRIERDVSVSWTGRDLIFVGFGRWRSEYHRLRIKGARKSL